MIIKLTKTTNAATIKKNLFFWLKTFIAMVMWCRLLYSLWPLWLLDVNMKLKYWIQSEIRLVLDFHCSC